MLPREGGPGSSTHTSRAGLRSHIASQRIASRRSACACRCVDVGATGENLRETAPPPPSLPRPLPASFPGARAHRLQTAAARLHVAARRRAGGARGAAREAARAARARARSRGCPSRTSCRERRCAVTEEKEKKLETPAAGARTTSSNGARAPVLAQRPADRSRQSEPREVKAVELPGQGGVEEEETGNVPQAPHPCCCRRSFTLGCRGEQPRLPDWPSRAGGFVRLVVAGRQRLLSHMERQRTPLPQEHSTQSITTASTSSDLAIVGSGAVLPSGWPVPLVSVGVGGEWEASYAPNTPGDLGWSAACLAESLCLVETSLDSNSLSVTAVVLRKSLRDTDEFSSAATQHTGSSSKQPRRNIQYNGRNSRGQGLGISAAGVEGAQLSQLGPSCTCSIYLCSITKSMSRLSGRLRSGGVRLGCGALAEEDCLEIETPPPWGGDEGHPGTAGGTTAVAGSGASLHYSFFSSPSLANGLRSPEERLHKRARVGARRRRQPEQVEQLDEARQEGLSKPQPEFLEAQQQSEPPPQAQLDRQMESGTNSVTEQPGSGSPLALNEITRPEACTDTVQPRTPPYCPANLHSSPKTDPSPPLQPALLPSAPVLMQIPLSSPVQSPPVIPSSVEGEKKYALRSSGRPRFPCRLRKSSRLRRIMDDEGRREEVEGDCVSESEKSWRVEGAGFGVLEESVQASGPNMSGDLLPLPHPAAEISSHTSDPLQATGPLSCRGRRRVRYVGVRKIVVKVARIPVNLSRRQKSYKISSLEPPGLVSGQEGGGGPGGEGGEGTGLGESGGVAPREPTALLKMKNNGKSVMVMFPPGELPVILKRRRGRPPKQVLPGQPDPREARANAAVAGEPKKPRRRRRVKLPSPQPSYVADTNDVKAEYGDVLSKLAFLNRQPPATGRCSPPRCWTPSEPESFHTPPENPGISTLLHRLTGFRRRGGRAGCMGGRGGGAAGSSEGFKSSFSDFFETIGKKRKVPPTEPGQPRKRGKGVTGGLSRAAALGLEPSGLASGEKVVRKRRSRKNGVLKSGQGPQEQEWANGGSNWGAKGSGRDIQNDRERGPGYQGCPSPRGRFTPCDMGKGFYPSVGASGSGGSGEEAQGLFAGYFRSLLDSDDSSDLLDISMSSPASRTDSRKLAPGYDSSSPGQSQRWSPAFPKRALKGHSPANDSPLQAQSNTTVRPPYSYSVSQTSPTTSFPKSAPPALSLSRSPSSPHPSGYPQYPSGYSSGQSSGGNSTALAQQRMSDCSFGYSAGLGNSKAPPTSPAGQCHMGFSGFQSSQALVKRSYSGYPGSSHSASLRGEAGPMTGPSSPGGSYIGMAKTSPFPSSSPPESCKQYPSAHWGYRQGYQTWGLESFGPHQYHSYSDYCASGSHESKDILDISNYTPQKAKQRSFSETLSESSSDSSHLGPAGVSMGGGNSGYRPRDNLTPAEGQSSLSSLEKLMMDWHENSAGPSYNWSQSVLFQGGSKPGRGRRKRAEAQGERDGCPLSFPPASPSSSSSPGPGPKRSPVAARQPRGMRGRGSFSSCQRDRATPGKPKAQKPPTPAPQSGGTGLFQDTLDYYSGDSSSLSPLPSQQQSFGLDACEYSSPYSVHPSTPSSEERFSQLFPGETSSLSPNISLQPEVIKPYPKLAHPPAYSAPPRTFSPSCSPSPRLLPSCSAAQSPHRGLGKDFQQYDSPSYCSSPCWYGQGGSLAGSPQSYESERPPGATLPPHGRTDKRDLSQVGGSGLRTAAPPHSPYPAPLHRGSSSSSCATVALDSSPLPEDMGFPVHPDSYPPMPHRYPPQPPRSGVLCQLLDQPAEDGFTVTSL
ncbi:AT-hook DNA-binding motif-containing protein 1 [Arapaima gigas]